MNTQSTRCGLLASAKMDKLLLVFLATVALVTSDEDGSEVLVGSFELFSTPPSPPLPEGERIAPTNVDPLELSLRTQDVLGVLNTTLIVDEVFQLTRQLAQGVDHRFRSIFRATDGEVYKVVWTIYPNAAGKWKLDGVTLFHMPPEYPNDFNVIESKKPQHTFQTADKAFSTPPTPPKRGGEVAESRPNTISKRRITQGVLTKALKSPIVVEEIYQFTNQVVLRSKLSGVQTRVIFAATNGGLYKVTWLFFPSKNELPSDAREATLFTLKGRHVVATQKPIGFIASKG